MLNPRIGAARFERDHGSAGVAEVVVDHAAERAFANPNARPSPRSRAVAPAFSAPFGLPAADVRLVEALEDVVRHVRRVQVVALVERARLEQLVPLLPT